MSAAVPQAGDEVCVSTFDVAVNTSQRHFVMLSAADSLIGQFIAVEVQGSLEERKAQRRRRKAEESASEHAARQSLNKGCTAGLFLVGEDQQNLLPRELRHVLRICRACGWAPEDYLAYPSGSCGRLLCCAADARVARGGRFATKRLSSKVS